MVAGTTIQSKQQAGICSMDTDKDLPTLVQEKDHLNVLRYIRIHQLREPSLVLEHGRALLGVQLNQTTSFVGSNELVRLACLEQICLAGMDCGDVQTAELCLKRLVEAGVAKSSTRFKLLLARLLEASDDVIGATKMYDALLKDNPANCIAMKRKYCLLKAVPGKQSESVEALNLYLQQNYSDTAAWYELSQLHKDLGDWKRAIFCLEEVILSSPASSTIHCELAECYATAAGTGGGNLNKLLSARKHMATALELDNDNLRAKFGLVTISNAYLDAAANAKKKDAVDEFEVRVAHELLKFGCEQVEQSYNKASPMFAPTQALMKEYRDGL